MRGSRGDTSGGTDVGGLGFIGRRSSDVGVDGEDKRHRVTHLASLLSQMLVALWKRKQPLLTRLASKGLVQ